MTTHGLDLLAALALIGAVLVALLGNSTADDLLAVSLVGLAGTIGGRGRKTGG